MSCINCSSNKVFVLEFIRNPKNLSESKKGPRPVWVFFFQRKLCEWPECKVVLQGTWDLIDFLLSNSSDPCGGTERGSFSCMTPTQESHSQEGIIIATVEHHLSIVRIVTIKKNLVRVWRRGSFLLLHVFLVWMFCMNGIITDVWSFVMSFLLSWCTLLLTAHVWPLSTDF